MVDVLGEVISDLEDQGLDGDVLGAVAHATKKALIRAKRGGATIHVQKPNWRDGQLAPGVEAPGEGYIPVGLIAQAGAPPGTFAAALPSIAYIGKTQKPYQARRLLASTVRTGASAVGRCLGQMFVGTDLMMGTLAAVDLELLGAATAFDTVMHFMQAPPGVEINIQVTLTPNVTGGDTVFLFLMFLGHVIH